MLYYIRLQAMVLYRFTDSVMVKWRVGGVLECFIYISFIINNETLYLKIKTFKM